MESLPPDAYRLYRPVKQQISLRVDAEVLASFRSQGGKYQTYMNQVLRRKMEAPPGKALAQLFGKQSASRGCAPDRCPLATVAAGSGLNQTL
jgi:BrnA antitoxin of type II toxin-antitoxin system